MSSVRLPKGAILNTMCVVPHSTLSGHRLFMTSVCGRVHCQGLETYSRLCLKKKNVTANDAIHDRLTSGKSPLEEE